MQSLVAKKFLFQAFKGVFRRNNCLINDGHIGPVYMGKSCLWLEGYPIPRVYFTECLYEEKLSLLAG